MITSLASRLLSAASVIFFFMVGASAVFAADDFGLRGAVGGTGIPVTSITGENGIIATIIFNILGIVGVLFLILMIWGGISWMTSGGNEQRLTKAKSVLTTATIGLIIILTAYSTTYFIVQNLTSIDAPTGQCDPTRDPNC